MTREAESGQDASHQHLALEGVHPVPDQGTARTDPAGSEPPAGGPGEAGQGGPAPGAAPGADLPLGLFTLDREWRFTSLNRYAERFFEALTGHPPAALLGRPIWEACPEVADSTFKKEYERAEAEGRRFDLEAFYPALGRWFALQARPADDARCFVLQDVSGRVELERALRRRAAALAEAERGKDEFLVRLAHKVRNSLVTIRNALHLLTGQAEADPEVERAYGLGEREVQSLSRLMDDLLEVSQITLGRIQPRKEKVDLAAVLTRSLNAV